MDAKTALAIVKARAGEELAERLEHLDRARAERRADEVLAAPDDDATPDVDVVFAGGGLSLLVAAEIARLGARVLVLERARAGAAHREWNASADELAPLVDAGVVDDDELARLVVARYREGICSFHGGSPRSVRGVLDHAIDAGPLLERARRVAEARGVAFVDGASVVGLGPGANAVRVGWTARDSGASREALARVVVDARGASSPYASADLVCPTVGGVVRGLRVGDGPREIDPNVGEILVTTEGAPDGNQHVWEGFPGRPGEVTVYLFRYARARDLPRGALVPLYARFFETLGTYKEGDAELVRPTFGYIPGWSRLVPPPASPSRRIVLVGDAAARHSPLTFCGFGSMLRTFQPAARRIAGAIADGVAPPASIVPDEEVHAWTGLLSSLMAAGSLRGGALNALLDDAFASLERMGNDAFSDLLKDRMTARDFATFLRTTAAKRPSAYRDVLFALGPSPMARWGVRLAKSALSRGASA